MMGLPLFVYAWGMVETGLWPAHRRAALLCPPCDLWYPPSAAAPTGGGLQIVGGARAITNPPLILDRYSNFATANCCAAILLHERVRRLCSGAGSQLYCASPQPRWFWASKALCRPAHPCALRVRQAAPLQRRECSVRLYAVQSCRGQRQRPASGSRVWSLVLQTRQARERHEQLAHSCAWA